jgi:hypothetical protein
MSAIKKLHFRPSPALFLATAALFLAVGGSALAVGLKSKPVPQLRCANGAIKGIAYVTGSPETGIANLPVTFSSDKTLFGTRFNCTGGLIEVKKDETTAGGAAVDVRFAGNPSKVAIGTPISASEPGALAVTPLPDGSFRVTVGGALPSNSSLNPTGPNNWGVRNNFGFVLILI